MEFERVGTASRLQSLEPFRLEVRGTRGSRVSAVEAEIVEVVVVLLKSATVPSPTSQLRITRLTFSVVKLAIGSKVALTKSSIVPSLRKQFI